MLFFTTVHASFDDVPESYKFHDEIRRLQNENIVKGYDNGLYLPEHRINRAEFLKILMEANKGRGNIPTVLESCNEDTFPDVDSSTWYAKYVCVAKSIGIIEGYPDGLFHPEQEINFSEAFKITVLAFGYDVKPDYKVWYKPYVDFARSIDAVPYLIIDEAVAIRRGEMAYVVSKFLDSIDPPLNYNPILEAFYESGILEIGNIRLEWHEEDAKQLNDPIRFVDKLQRVYNAYEDMVGGKPNPTTVVFRQLCPYEAGKDGDTITPECPNGFMWYNAWGLAGDPVRLSDNAVSDIIRDANNGELTFGLIHELAHVFDISTRAQYIFNSTSTEAWANLKLAFVLDKANVKTRLNNTLYQTTEDIFSNFYRPYYLEYKNRGYTFADLHDDSPIVHHLADYYFGIIEDKLRYVSMQSLFDTLSLYYSEQNSLRYLVDTDREEKMNQFVYFWSAKAGYDLSELFEADSFPISDMTKFHISTILSTPENERTNALIIALDKDAMSTAPDDVVSGLQQLVQTYGYTALGDPVQKGGVWVQSITDGNGDGYGMYNSFEKKAYYVPWWNASYLDSNDAFSRFGAPTGDFFHSTLGWRQDFEQGSLVMGDDNVVFRIGGN